MLIIGASVSSAPTPATPTTFSSNMRWLPCSRAEENRRGFLEIAVMSSYLAIDQKPRPSRSRFQCTDLRAAAAEQLVRRALR
jgi:hypothetical protein